MSKKRNEERTNQTAHVGIVCTNIRRSGALPNSTINFNPFNGSPTVQFSCAEEKTTFCFPSEGALLTRGY